MTAQELAELNKNRKIYQICVVTKDINRSIKDMVEYVSIGPWRIFTLNNKTVKDANFLMKDGTLTSNAPFEFYAATCMVGDLQFELIQPVYGDTMYQRFLDSGREGLHHIKEKITLADWEDTKSKFINQGMQVTSSGWLGTSFFGYFNTEPTLKFDFEVGNCPDKVEFPKECETRVFPEPIPMT